MIPLSIPNLSGNEARYLQECVDTNFVSSVGPFVERFERMVAEATGAQKAVATVSGTAALHAALLAVGVARDDLVLLPAFTFIASANAVSHCGALPWLLDVDDASWTLAPDRVEEALARDCERAGDELRHRATGRRVAAVLPVYALGLPADMDALVEIARVHGLPVVADAAAAIGASYRRRALGALGADLTVLSFNGNKTVTAGGGGAVLSNDGEHADGVRHLTTTAKRGEDYEHDAVGFNYRMTNVSAAVGCAQLEQLQTFVAAKRRIAAEYLRAFADQSGVESFPAPEWAESAHWLSGVLLRTQRATEVAAGLQKMGIGARGFWKPMHEQAPYRESPRGETPVTDRIWRSILTLPCSTSLSPTDQQTVIRGVRECLPDG